ERGVGLRDLAERVVDFLLEKSHQDGKPIQLVELVGITPLVRGDAASETTRLSDDLRQLRSLKDEDIHLVVAVEVGIERQIRRVSDAGQQRDGLFDRPRMQLEAFR